MSDEPRATAAADRLKGDVDRAVSRIRTELDRIELLSVALGAFTKPVPDYKPGFRHLNHLSATALELKGER
jgi:hypothetical protein